MRFSEDRGGGRGRRRLGPRTPFLLPLLLFCLGVTLWAAGGGCGLAPGGGEAEGTPPSTTDTLTRAVDALKRGDVGAGAGYINQAVRERGDSSAAVTAVASQLMQIEGRALDAVQLLQNWLAKRPDAAWDPMLWVTLGQAQRSAGDTEGAAKTDAEAKKRAEAIMQNVGRLEPARPPLILPKTRDAVERFLRAGEFYTSFDGDFDFPRGLNAFREAKRLLPNEPGPLAALGYALADKGSSDAEYNEALQLTKQAAELAPDNGQVLDAYGWALFKKNDYAGARRVLRQAVDAAPDEPEIRYHLGVVYAQLDRKQEALLEFNRALRLRPGYPPAQTEKMRLTGVPGNVL